MTLTRRTFLAGAGALAAMGAVEGAPAALAWADEPETEAADQAENSLDSQADALSDSADGILTVCEGCPVGCTARVVMHDGAITGVEGDGDNPVSEGTLCARGRRMADVSRQNNTDGALVPNKRRLDRPRVRRPGSRQWEELSWDMAMGEIATLVKQVRDETFVEYEGDVPVFRTDALASFGGGRLLVEEQFLLARALRSWGVVNIDNEAAFGRRAFAAGTAATFGIEAPDGAWSDAANASVILTVGSDHAANQPLSVRWIERAREAGGHWIVLDPARTRTAEMADIHVPLRPGTDTAFFGGLAKYLIEGNLWQPEYVLNYTNASYLTDPSFTFDADSGLFSGWNPTNGSYDKTSWGYVGDGFETWNMRFDGEFSWVRGEGVPIWTIPAIPKPLRDITLQDTASVWSCLRAFYQRYDLDTVSAVCGVDRALLEDAYQVIASTSTTEAVAKVVAGPGLVQHGIGSQAVRAASIVQLLLGNVGVPGGGLQYTGGSANEITADAMGLSPTQFAGGVPVPTVSTANLQQWMETHTAPAGERSLNPKKLVSALKEWWGSAATLENSYGFDWIPKAPDALGKNGASPVSATVAAGSVRGLFVWGADVLAKESSGLTAESLSQLEWLVVTGSVPTATAEFWRNAADVESVQTTVFSLPAAAGFEKAGTRSAQSRLLQFVPAVGEPFEDSRPEANIIGELWRRVCNLYDTREGISAEPILSAAWGYGHGNEVDLCQVGWSLNGYMVESGDWDAGETKLIEGADGLRADGSVACGAGCLAGLWNNIEAPYDYTLQPVGRRDATDETGLGLFSQWGFSWPRNVRVRGNRASTNLAGQPWRNDRTLLYWDGQTWTSFDAPDFPALRDGRWIEPTNCAFPGVWEQVGLLLSDRLDDGPMPEHYEALESPLNNRLNSSYASPLMLEAASEAKQVRESAEMTDAVAEGTASEPLSSALRSSDYTEVLPDRNAYPIGAFLADDDDVAVSWQQLSDAARAFEPGFFVEVSPALSQARGVRTGDMVRVFNERGSVEAPALVTERLTTFLCQGSEAHYACLHGRKASRQAAASTGDSRQGAEEYASWSVLVPEAVNPVGNGREAKGFLVDIARV